MTIKIRKSDFTLFEQLLFGAEFDSCVEIEVKFYDSSEEYHYKSVLVNDKWIIETV